MWNTTMDMNMVMETMTRESFGNTLVTSDLHCEQSLGHYIHYMIIPVCMYAEH
jgi:hypothetical protein